MYIGSQSLIQKTAFPLQSVDILRLTATAQSMAAGRISYLNNRTGPCLLIDTACSSTLVATDLAGSWVLESQNDAVSLGSMHIAQQESVPLATSGFLSS